MCFAFSTYPHANVLVFPISIRASRIGFPVSLQSKVAKSSAFSSTRSANFSMILPRSCSGTFAHVFCASTAFLTQASTSSAVAFGTVSKSSLVAGLYTSITAPLLASLNSPATKFFIDSSFYSSLIPVNDSINPPQLFAL